MELPQWKRSRACVSCDPLRNSHRASGVTCSSWSSASPSSLRLLPTDRRLDLGLQRFVSTRRPTRALACRLCKAMGGESHSQETLGIAKSCKCRSNGEMEGRNRLRIFGKRVRYVRISLQCSRERAHPAACGTEAAAHGQQSGQAGRGGRRHQPSATIAQDLPAGHGWLDLMCYHCERRAGPQLDRMRQIRRHRYRKHSKPIPLNAAPRRARGHDQADKRTEHHPCLGWPR